ncbi:MAG: MFS transporter, partial [Patescibacteria group bacterium]|nr:MFS transporter [Patescibacteria group bacterium]
MKFLFKRTDILFALVTMFLNFLGFTLLIPVIPFIVEKYLPASSASQVGLYVGFLVSAYGLCQFLSAPTLGLLSDRFGRRPILLISLLGTVIGYLFLGIGGAMWVLFAGRIIDGLTGGNISTLYAYIADVSEPNERGKLFGLLGAAGGVGFIIGPVVGGYIGAVHISLPFFVGAVVVFLNMLWGYFVLPESLAHEHKIQKIQLSHL